jgi:integrase
MNGELPFSASFCCPGFFSASNNLGWNSPGKGRRFGPHNLMHNLSTLLVKQGRGRTQNRAVNLRHSRIQTTLDLYMQEDGDATRAVRGQVMGALDMPTEMDW